MDINSDSFFIALIYAHLFFLVGPGLLGWAYLALRDYRAKAPKKRGEVIELRPGEERAKEAA